MKEENSPLQLTLNAFKESNVNLPTAVENAVRDVFDENDNIGTVDFFFMDGVEDFEQELTLENRVTVNLDGTTEGQTNDVFTYYGNLKISLSEFVSLYKGDDLINKITEIDNRERPTELVDKKDFAVVLVETTKFTQNKGEEGTYEVSDVLRIYCPVMEE